MRTCLSRLVIVTSVVIVTGCVTPDTYDHLVRNGLAPPPCGTSPMPSAQWQPLPAINSPTNTDSHRLEQRIGHLEAKLAYLERENDRLREQGLPQVHPVPLSGAKYAISRSGTANEPVSLNMPGPPPVYLHMLAESPLSNVRARNVKPARRVQARLAAPIPVEAAEGEYRAASFGGWRAR